MLPRQLKSGFKGTIKKNKYQSTITTEAQKQNLVILPDPSFWGMNKFVVLAFANTAKRASYTFFYS